MSGTTYKEYAEVPAYEQATFGEKGNVNNADPSGSKPPIWSGKFPPPAVGEKIRMTINSIGPGTVRGYFTESGFLGLLVQPESPPEWYVKQNGPNAVGHIFGIEWKPLEAK
jgi:hypothetical protein